MLQENLEAWMSKLSERSECYDHFDLCLECQVRQLQLVLLGY